MTCRKLTGLELGLHVEEIQSDLISDAQKPARNYNESFGFYIKYDAIFFFSMGDI